MDHTVKTFIASVAIGTAIGAACVAYTYFTGMDSNNDFTPALYMGKILLRI